MKYVLYYPTAADFLAAEGVEPGNDVHSIVPGVAWTVNEDIVDYNPLPAKALIFVNNTNTEGTVTLTARNLGDVSSVSGNRPKIEIDYCTDGMMYETTASTDNPQTGETLSFTLPANGKLYLKGENTKFAVGTSVENEFDTYCRVKCWSFSCDVSHSLEGFLSALVDNEEEMQENYEFAGLFSDDETLTNVSDSVLSYPNVTLGGFAKLFVQSQNGNGGLQSMPKITAETIGDYGCLKMFQNAHFEAVGNLPAMTLGRYAYKNMFDGSKHVTGMTILPAVDIEYGVYDGMFGQCTALTLAPEIMAENAYPYCFSCMFYNCSSLQNPPVMHLTGITGNGDTNLAIAHCQYMFRYCSSLRDTPSFFENIVFTTESSYKALPDKYAYQYMFHGCTSLTGANFTLKADRFYDFAYAGMFKGCTSLITPPVISAYHIKQYGCKEMFAGCTSLASIPVLHGIECGRYVFQDMFRDCVSITSIEIPNPYLGMGNYGYSAAFSGCSSLNQVKALFTASTVTNYTQNWLDGVAATGTFIRPASVAYDDTPGNGIVPANWNVVDV